MTDDFIWSVEIEDDQGFWKSIAYTKTKADAWTQAMHIPVGTARRVRQYESVSFHEVKDLMERIREVLDFYDKGKYVFPESPFDLLKEALAEIEQLRAKVIR